MQDCSPNRASSWAWVRRPTSCAGPSPTCATWASRCSPSASTCGRRASTCRSRGGGRRRSSRSSAPTPRASGSGTSRRDRSSAPATTPSGPRNPPRSADVYVERLARARARMAELGVDVLLLSTGADLPYLTGYEAMPLERLTMLVLPADGDAVLVVPRLEAPRVEERPDVFTLRPWEETEDPV